MFGFGVISIWSRNARDLSEALEDASRFDLGSSEYQREGTDDPSRSSLMRAFQRLDILSMLLQRRQFHDDAAADRILGITLYSDASPVTGEELQGMAMDVVYRDETITTSVMPGATLPYGQYGAFAKVVALVWAAWLVAGPTLKHMQYFFDKVSCVTTDGGTELQLLEMPNFLRAFIAWNSGMPLAQVRPKIDVGTRLFRNALRISGWSHPVGNIMREIAMLHPDWPEVLSKLRDLTRFFRVQAWRQHLQRALKHHHEVNAGRKLRFFSAGFAKWRYETLARVLEQLAPLRPICEHYIEGGMFPSFKDGELLQSVLRSCQDQELWRFIVFAHAWVFAPLEKLRRWGLVCECHAAERKAGVRNIGCKWASRRLRNAWTEVSKVIDTFRTAADELTMERCGGSNSLFRIGKSMLILSAESLNARFKYLDVVPWLFARADTRDGARRCIEMVRQRPGGPR